MDSAQSCNFGPLPQPLSEICDVTSPVSTSAPYVLDLKSTWASLGCSELDCLRAALETILDWYGAALIRGTGLTGSEPFQQAIQVLCGSRWARYREAQSPRAQFTQHVFSSTEHPRTQIIHPHNENAHGMTWPRRIYFFCERPSTRDGATTIASGQGVARHLPASLTELLFTEGVLYSRSFGFEVGPQWSESFGNVTKLQLERYFRVNEMDWEWIAAERLKLSYRRPAFVAHPVSKEILWCNNIAHYHPTTLETRIGRLYMKLLPPDQLPYNARYGSGSEFSDCELEDIRGAYRKALYRFDWRPGDLLLLDNMRFSHGRETFEGDRLVYVCMSHPVHRVPGAPAHGVAEVLEGNGDGLFDAPLASGPAIETRADADIAIE